MISKVKQIVASLIGIATLFSCTEEIDVDVPSSTSRLVVEASIDWERGTSGENQTVKLSTTSNYFDQHRNTSVSGAIVQVVNDRSGTVYQFEDQGDGTYVTEEFEPVLGQSYTLEVEYEGQSITATETMTAVSEIIRVEQTTEEGFSSDDTEITVHYNDPVGEDNYYMAEFFPSHKPLPTLWVFYDLFTDGNETIFFYEDEEFEPGIEVDINLLGISERYYRYMNLIILQSSQSITGPFQTSPVQVRGNLSNRTNSEIEVLGYFRLCEVIRTSHTIE